MKVIRISAKLASSLFLVSAAIFLVVSIIRAQSLTGTVTSSVRLSVCGDLVKDSDEDCDNSDLEGRMCSELGFTGGNLDCDSACDFDVSGCTIPVIDPDDVSSDDLPSLLAAGYFNKPSSASFLLTPSLTVANEITVVIPASGGNFSLVLPKDVVITESLGESFDPTTLSSEQITPGSLTGFSANEVVKAGLQWGLNGQTLLFNSPIDINLYVGHGLSGKTLNVFRSSQADFGWTTDGIVAPATCLVSSSGLCSFQTTMASYYAATQTTLESTPTPTPTSAPTSTSGSSSTSSSSGSGTSTSVVAQVVNIVKDVLRRVGLSDPLIIYDIDGDNNISINEMAIAVQKWADSFFGVLESQFTVNAATSPEISDEVEKCDINEDGSCSIIDFSVLLYFVEK